MDAVSVREAIKIWQDNYIHVQGIMDEFVTLRERTKYLRDEVRNVRGQSVLLMIQYSWGTCEDNLIL